MNRSLSALVLVAGVLLLIAGIRSSDSIVSSFSRLFTGTPTDHAIWLLAGGSVLIFLGLGGALRSSKS